MNKKKQSGNLIVGHPVLYNIYNSWLKVTVDICQWGVGSQSCLEDMDMDLSCTSRDCCGHSYPDNIQSNLYNQS